MEFRPFYFAREWVNSGHEVLIIASSFSHIRNNNPNIVEKDYLDTTISGISYRWLLSNKYTGNGIKRVFNMLTFIYRLFKYSNDISRSFSPDVVIASSTYPLDIWPAYKISKQSKAKLIFELHDIWPLTPIELGQYSKFNPYIIAMQISEYFTYKKANFVISLLPKADLHIKNFKFDLTNYLYVPNGTTNDNNYKIYKNDRDVQKIENDIQLLKDKGYFILGYAGSHGIPNALIYLLKAAKLLQNIKVAFILLGDGSNKENLVNFSKECSLENVYFYNKVSKKYVRQILSCFDIGYIGWMNNPLYRFGISPNKIIEYMSASLPILHSVSAVNDPVSDAACGISVPAEDEVAIAKAIIKFMEMPKIDRIHKGLNGNRYVKNNHLFSKLASKIINFIS
jgi:glycosyltransferase involved in cell wall biosynthesis